MADDDLIRRLESLGEAEPDGLDHERRRTIEDRVVALARTGRVDESSRRKPLLMAAAAILLVLAFGVVAAVLTGDEGPRIEAATGTVRLELPDGSVVPAIAGADLPDGTVIDVAPDSIALVDGVTLGPGRYALRDGRAVDIATDRAPADRAPTDRTPADRTTIGRDVVPTTTIPQRDDSPVRDAPPTTERPRRTTTTDVAVDRRRDLPSATDAPRPAPTTTTATRTTAATTTIAATTTTTTTTTPPRDRTDRTTTSLPPETTTTVADRRDDRPGDG